MKKVLFVLAACLTLTLGFTSCNIKEGVKITISVVDANDKPVADREVYYTEDVSLWSSVVAPSPDAPLRDDDIDDLPFYSTNAQGIVEDVILPNLNYYYFVLDKGTNKYQAQSVKGKDGEKKELTFKVNK